MKKILALVMCFAMVFSLAACSGNTASSGSSSTATSNDSSATGDAASEAVANRTETGKIVLCFMNWVGAMDAQAEVQKAMNEITRKSLNLEVELNIMDSASYSQSMTLMLAGGEQVDLFSAISIGYTSCINNGYVINLEDDNLIQTYGSGILKTMSEASINGCRVNDALYGTPVNKDDAIGLDAYAIPTAYLDAIGFTDYDKVNVTTVTQAQIDDILAKMHTQYPDKETIAPQTATLGQSVMFDNIGGDIYGVLLDPLNSLTVSDLFSSDAYMNQCKKYYNYNQLGYISGDALTNDVAATTRVRTGDALCYQTATKPGIVSQESSLCGQQVAVLQIGEDFMKSSTFSSMPWCISENTADKVAAMQYLNELYTNSELSTLLCWGREGSEWKYTDDGHITYADGVTADTSGYLHNVNWQLPNQFIAGVFEGNDLDLWDQMKTFNSGAKESKAIGFNFDNSSVSTEYTALANIYNEYQKQLEFGFSDPTTAIPEMVERLKKAGLDTYITEKQNQLDTWAKAAGVN